MKYDETIQQTEQETILTSDNNCFVWAHKAQIDVEGLAQAHHQSPSTATQMKVSLKFAKNVNNLRCW